MARIVSGVLTVFVLAVVIAGCANSNIGSGPLKLSPRAQAHYQEYKRRSEPGAFVVGENGGAYYSYCPTTSCMGGIMTAMRLCRDADAGECYVYDIDGQIVWRFDEPPPARANSVSEPPLIHCLLRGSRVLTTRTACQREGGTQQDD